MSLTINTVRPQIQINTTNARLDIQQPKGEQQLRTTMPKAIIRSEKPKVIIDQYQCFAESGLKNVMDLTREAAQLGRQAAMQAIARIAEDGNRLAQVENKMPDAIPELAEKNAWAPERVYDIATMPMSRPKIDVVGSIDIQWEMGKVNHTYTPRKPVVNYIPGKVDIYLKQKPSIEIRYIDEKV